MATNYITITYKDLLINILCKKRILEGSNIYVYFNNEDELNYVTNLFDNLGISHGIINTPKTIGIVASVKDLIIDNENNVKDDDELYKFLSFIHDTYNLAQSLHNRICDDLSLIKTIIDNANELHDAAVVNTAIDIEKTLNLIRENIKSLERHIFFAKPNVNEKVLLSSQFSRYDFETIVYIHVFMKNSEDAPDELKFFADIDCYVDKSVIDKIKSIDSIVIKLVKSMFNDLLKVKPNALDEAKKLILEWWK